MKNRTVSIKPKVLKKTLVCLLNYEYDVKTICEKIRVSEATWYRIKNTLKSYGVKIVNDNGIYHIVNIGIFDIDKLKIKIKKKKLRNMNSCL